MNQRPPDAIVLLYWVSGILTQIKRCLVVQVRLCSLKKDKGTNVLSFWRTEDLHSSFLYSRAPKLKAKTEYFMMSGDKLNSRMNFQRAPTIPCQGYLNKHYKKDSNSRSINIFIALNNIQAPLKALCTYKLI